MSKSLTPKELDYLQRRENIPNITMSLMVQIGEEMIPAYSDEQKEMASRYPKLGMFGFDMLNRCMNNGVYQDERGKAILQQIENYFNGQEIEDKELAENAQKWYEGNFCPGFYMNDNDCEFADYLKSRISARVISRD